MKRFSRALYDKHDKRAKDIAKDFFSFLNFEIIDDGEHYGDYDFAIKSNDKIQTVEVEQKTQWYGKPFPFRTMDVAGRKKKSKADWFIQINNDGTSFNICKMSVVHSSEQYRKNTIYSTNELFFAVARDQFTTIYKDDCVWVIPCLPRNGQPNSKLYADDLLCLL